MIRYGWSARRERERPFEVGPLGEVETDDDLIKEVDTRKRLDDCWQRRTIDLAGKRNDDRVIGCWDRSSRSIAGLEFLMATSAEIVKRGDHTVLEEVTHVRAAVPLCDGKWPDAFVARLDEGRCNGLSESVALQRTAHRR